MSDETPRGRKVANMIADVQHDARVATTAAESVVKRYYEAGRLAGLREAADVIVSQIQPPYTGTRSDDFMLGWAQGANDTAERNRSAILALASSKETP